MFENVDAAACLTGTPAPHCPRSTAILLNSVPYGADTLVGVDTKAQRNKWLVLRNHKVIGEIAGHPKIDQSAAIALASAYYRSLGGFTRVIRARELEAEIYGGRRGRHSR